MKNPVDVLRGRERSSVVFWFYCVLGSAVLTALFLMSARPLAESMPDSQLLFLVIPYFAYLAWAHIALWTCAFNTKRRAWGYAARTYSFALLALMIWSWIWPYFVTLGPIEVRQIAP